MDGVTNIGGKHKNICVKRFAKLWCAFHRTQQFCVYSTEQDTILWAASYNRNQKKHLQHIRYLPIQSEKSNEKFQLQQLTTRKVLIPVTSLNNCTSEHSDFKDVTPCSLVEMYQYFRETCCLQIQRSLWKWKQQFHPKLRHLSTPWQSITLQKTLIITYTTIKNPRSHVR
jgi:hypothetical protein